MAPPGTKSYPTAAFVLTLIGGIFILLNGIVLAALSAVLGGFALGFFPGLGALLIALGVVALLFGLIVIYGAVKMHSGVPGSVRTWGIIVILMSLISLVMGGGFYIGTILALVGGILALVWHPPTVAQPAWGQPTAPMGGAPAGGAAPGQKFCGSCGSANMAGATTCAKCGAPLPA